MLEGWKTNREYLYDGYDARISNSNADINNLDTRENGHFISLNSKFNNLNGYFDGLDRGDGRYNELDARESGHYNELKLTNSDLSSRLNALNNQYDGLNSSINNVDAKANNINSNFNNYVNTHPVIVSEKYDKYGIYYWTVPNGVTRLLVKMGGAGSSGGVHVRCDIGICARTYPYSGFNGEEISAIVDVVPLSTIRIVVGHAGMPTYFFEKEDVNKTVTAIKSVQGGNSCFGSLIARGGPPALATLYGFHTNSAPYPHLTYYCDPYKCTYMDLDDGHGLRTYETDGYGTSFTNYDYQGITFGHPELDKNPSSVIGKKIMFTVPENFITRPMGFNSDSSLPDHDGYVVFRNIN